MRDGQIVLTPVQHWSGRGLTDRRRTLWGGYAVFAAQLHLFFAGDTGYSKDFRDIGERFQSHYGVEIVDGIGSTEMFHIFVSSAPEQVRRGAYIVRRQIVREIDRLGMTPTMTTGGRGRAGPTSARLSSRSYSSTFAPFSQCSTCSPFTTIFVVFHSPTGLDMFLLGGLAS